VTSIDISIGRCTVNTTRTTGSKQCSFTLEYGNFTSFLVNCSDTKYVTCFVTDQIKCDPFYEELRTHFHVALIKRVKKCVTCTVGSSTCTWHRFFTVVRRVTTEWALVNRTISVTVKWHTQVFYFVSHLRCSTRHKFGCVIDTHPVRTFYCVVEMVVPVIFLHITKRCTNTTLRCHSVRTGWENFGQYRNFQTSLSKLVRRTHT